MAKGALNTKANGHIQANCPNRRTLTIKEIEEIDQIHLATSEEDEEMQLDATVLVPDKGELLVV